MSKSQTKFTSPYWKYFTKVEGTHQKAKAKCALCEKLVSLGGSGKTATTSGLKSHLEHHHREEYRAIHGAPPKNKDSTNLPESSSSSTSDRVLTQVALPEMLERKKIWDINDARATKFHYLIGEMIALDNEPYTIVTRTGFQRLLNQALPQYSLPSNMYFRDKIIPDMYQRCKAAVAAKLSQATFISFTTDIWSCTHNNNSFISLTAHWLTHEAKRENYVLNSNFFPGSHTAEMILNQMNKMFLDWNVEKKNIHLIMRDSGANIIRACTDGDLTNESCFLHNLHLVIKESIKSQRAVMDLISVSKHIVSHFNHSPLATNKLLDIQMQLNTQPKKLVQDVETRWNSTYYLLERILEQKNAICLYLADNSAINNLNGNQWSLLESILNLLQPFEEVTKIISKKDSTISEVIPFVEMLKCHLSKKTSAFTGVGTMRDVLKANLVKRFCSISEKKTFALATCLDPRYKLSFFPAEIKSTIQTQLIEEATTSAPSVEGANPPEIEINPPPAKTRREECHSSLWDCYTELCGEDLKEDTSSKTAQNVKSEAEAFLKTPLLSRKESPFEWWQKYKEVYPNLFRLAGKYLSAPASNIYSERAFSEAGLIYEDMRSRLRPDRAESLLFLHYNLSKIQYTY